MGNACPVAHVNRGRNKATVAKKSLGIRHAKAVPVHLAHPPATHECRRRWTGLALALTVSFTVCDARQVGASLSHGAWLSVAGQVAFRMVRPEQKATPALDPLPAPRQSFTAREPILRAPSLDSAPPPRRTALPLVSGAAFVCSQSILDEWTRGPPLMDPPHFC